MTSDTIVHIATPIEEKSPHELINQDNIMKVAMLEEQLAAVNDKMHRRETVISQLEEEIRAKEELVAEQKHLIEVLDAVHNNAKNEENEKEDSSFMTGTSFDEVSIQSDAEVTVIENHPEPSTSKAPEDLPQPAQCIFDEMERLRVALRRAMIDREKLELQNEQLLRQWEEALEYVSTVQRQLQEEMQRCCILQEQSIEGKKRHQDMVCVSRDFVQFLGVFAAVMALWLYML
ncbi:unnamed protein product, partial [Mesorhabditis spiculigera]